MQCFGGVLRDPASPVLDLVATTGARGNNERISRRRADGWKKHQSANLHRKLEMLFLVAKRTGHSTTTGGNELNLVIQRQLKGFYRWSD